MLILKVTGFTKEMQYNTKSDDFKVVNIHVKTTTKTASALIFFRDEYQPLSCRTKKLCLWEGIPAHTLSIRSWMLLFSGDIAGSVPEIMPMPGKKGEMSYFRVILLFYHC